MIAQLADPRDLDALLGRIQFRPRASLGGEVAGRWARGDRPTPNLTPVMSKLVWLGLMLLLLGAVLYLVQSEFGLAQVRTVDRCCEDFDGGGDRDDGMLVVSRRGSEVQRLAIYEDLDGSRSYTSGDALRFDRSGRPSLQQRTRYARNPCSSAAAWAPPVMQPMRNTPVFNPNVRAYS